MASPIPKSLAHVITIGTAPMASSANVVEALAADLIEAAPRRVVLLATKDSEENAKHLLQIVGTAKDAGRIRLLDSAQSLDDAYAATNEELAKLEAEGFLSSEIILHYTAGTKVMSAGAVLAAVTHEVRSLRYLFSPGQRRPSEPVTTEPRVILFDGKLRLARTLFEALRFAAARDVLLKTDCEAFSPEVQKRLGALAELASLLDDWDNFRAASALRRWEKLYNRTPATLGEEFGPYLPHGKQIEALREIASAAENPTSFPAELLFDVVNNAIRRIAEHRPDDAMIRLHRAAELYAQRILIERYEIRTDDVEIRKVPPRHRTAFEAERRVDDATIKLGLRKSYDLLAILGDPVGARWAESEPMRRALSGRRTLVLAHGKRPATTRQALEFLEAFMALIEVNFPKASRQMQELQFRWIDNKAMLDALRKEPEKEPSVLASKEGRRSGKPRSRRR